MRARKFQLPNLTPISANHQIRTTIVQLTLSKTTIRVGDKTIGKPLEKLFFQDFTVTT